MDALSLYVLHDHDYAISVKPASFVTYKYPPEFFPSEFFNPNSFHDEQDTSVPDYVNADPSALVPEGWDMWRGPPEEE